VTTSPKGRISGPSVFGGGGAAPAPEGRLGWAEAHRIEWSCRHGSVMRLCLRGPTSPVDHVGKVAPREATLPTARRRLRVWHTYYADTQA
jgi:hypothetical protein